MRAGHTVLRKIADDDALYERLEPFGASLEEGVRDNLRALELDYYTTRVGSMAGLFFHRA
jgi:glutamate-1-semialdehyde 2,1-aminomutase